jgi:hypothetical protein
MAGRGGTLRSVTHVEKLLARIDDRDRELDAMNPTACREAAELVRGAKPRLATERQRQLADEIAGEFESRAARGPRSRVP